ncbi:TRAP transporter small permease subunit [Pollutimonas thiosulfatoxidans]|uniref:TRAP transporter small permease protein n=1 Tax=Pollutimonas thiosulfatoxidans TaxID=2028345 RepID=A0A410G8L8_9BURK|nr:TRAP transporter small permease subunit [Pollutimonas thiosulfatoxidans]QAA92643.1 sugar transporter [Pollutimonas thiosulfatoxidans]
MRLLLAFSKLIDAFNDRIGIGVSWALLAAVLICTANALVRYSLHIGSNAWLEIQWYLFAAIFLLAASHTLRRNEHVRIDLLAGRLPKRVQVGIDIVGFTVFLLPMCFIIITYSIPYVRESFVSGEISMNAGGLLVWPVKALIPISFLMLFAQGVSEIIKRIGFLFHMVDASEFDKQSRNELEVSKAELEAALANRPGDAK